MNTEAAPGVLFREEQSFTQPWLWMVVTVIAGIQWWSFSRSVIMGHPYGNPTPDWALVLLWVLCGLGLPWLIASCRLITQVQSDALYVQFRPFHLHPQEICYSVIATAEAVRYRPLYDYGGWGLRCGRGGMAYNVSGNRGVRLALTNGRHLLIGSQLPEELAAAIESARKS